MNKKCIMTMSDQKQEYGYAFERLAAMGIDTEWYKDEIRNSQDPDTVIHYCKDASFIINGIEIWSEKVIEACRNLEMIVRYGVGYNAIDVESATRHGVAVAYLPGVNATAVAEHTVALMLAGIRKLAAMDRMLHQGCFHEANYLVPQLSDKTVGIIGCGNIGKNVVRMLSGFNCNFMAYDMFRDERFAKQYGVIYTELDEVFGHSDIITVHVPVLPETRHIIDKDAIAKMKDGVVIVNTSRGETVCSADLKEALLSGKVFAAGLDVFEGEGKGQVQQTFCGLDNVVMTPHVASSTFEAYRHMMDKSVDIIQDYIRGRDTPGCILNPEYKDYRRYYGDV